MKKEEGGKVKRGKNRYGREEDGAHRAKWCRHAWICQVRWWEEGVPARVVSVRLLLFVQRTPFYYGALGACGNKVRVPARTGSKTGDSARRTPGNTERARKTTELVGYTAARNTEIAQPRTRNPEEHTKETHPKISADVGRWVSGSLQSG
jgi:hypothetical protein